MFLKSFKRRNFRAKKNSVRSQNYSPTGICVFRKSAQKRSHVTNTTPKSEPDDAKKRDNLENRPKIRLSVSLIWQSLCIALLDYLHFDSLPLFIYLYVRALVVGVFDGAS